MTEASSDDQRLAALLNRIAAAERKLNDLEEQYNDPVERVKRTLLAKKIFSAKFDTVHSAYYDLTLEQRAELLSCTVHSCARASYSRTRNTIHRW